MARAREAFDDELLVRGRDGYELTPRGLRVREQLIALLPLFEQLITPDREFDPDRDARGFRLTAADYALMVLGPSLVRRLQEASPQCRLHFQPWNDRVFDDVDRGATELALRGVAAPRTLKSESLYEEQFLCVVSTDHPFAKGERIELADYLGCRHVAVDLEEGGQPTIERRLSLIAPRSIHLSMPTFAAAALAVPGTEFVATLPARLATRYAAGSDVRMLAPPQEIESMTVRMVWHPRLDDDPGHRWLRQTVRAVTAPLRAEIAPRA